jgi:hypothetical protein
MLSLARQGASPTKTTEVEAAAAVRDSLNATPSLHKLQGKAEKLQEILSTCSTTLDMLNRRILRWPSEAFQCSEDGQTPAIAAVVCAATERGAARFDRATTSLESWLKDSGCADMLPLIRVIDRAHLTALSEPGLRICSREGVGLSYPLLTHVHGSAWDREQAQRVSAIQQWFDDYIEEDYEEDDEPHLEDYLATSEPLSEPKDVVDLAEMVTKDASTIHDHGQDVFFEALRGDDLVKIIGKEDVRENTIYTILHRDGTTSHRRMAPDMLQHQNLIMDFERSPSPGSYLVSNGKYPTEDFLVKKIEFERDGWGQKVQQLV